MKLIRNLTIIGGAALLSACGLSHETNYVPEKSTKAARSGSANKDNLKIEVAFIQSGDSSDLLIPFLLIATREPAPDTVQVRATSTKRPSGTLTLSKLELVTEEGTVHDLLGEKSQSLIFSANSPYQASYKSGKIPVRLKDGQRVTVNVEVRDHGKTRRLSQSFARKTDGDVSFISPGAYLYGILDGMFY